MNPPSRKALPKLAGELGKYVIPNHIIRMYDGKVIDDGIDSCERCGSKHLQRHGTKERLFCKVILESDFKDVYIRRQVYRCVHCHHANVLQEGSGACKHEERKAASAFIYNCS